MYFVALMDENVVASETQYFAPKDCFDLNEPLLFFFFEAT